jgi:DNA polymerase
MARWAESALSWWQEAGVDTIVGEEPHDWLADAKPSPAKASAPEPRPPAPAADLPGDLRGFQDWLATAEALPLAATGAPRIKPAGAATSGLMVISDTPTAEDVAAGTLISGEQGQLFDRMLNAIGIGRDEIYLAPFSPIRPATKLGQGEIDLLGRIMRHHIGLVGPKALLVLGDGCSRALFGAPTARTRGRWHDLDTPAGPVRALVTIRPQELLANAKLKALAWADLQMLREGLKP